MTATAAPRIIGPAAPAEPAEPDARGGLVLHGTVVRWLERGILITGASGAGKSDLALRLIEQGAVLVADDLVTLDIDDDRLLARPYGPSGLIELRGLGIFRLPAVPSTTLDLRLELSPQAEEIGRLPPPATRQHLGIALACHGLDPRPASATARLRTLLQGERVW